MKFMIDPHVRDPTHTLKAYGTLRPFLSLKDPVHRAEVVVIPLIARKLVHWRLLGFDSLYWMAEYSSRRRLEEFAITAMSIFKAAIV
jgi:hypothetical protein